jgi:hypothetical protein
MELLQRSACLHERKTMNLPWRTFQKFYLQDMDVKGKKIWVTMSVGTLVTNEGRMLGCIEEKHLVSCALIWNRD